jgi:hypothetical protein
MIEYIEQRKILCLDGLHYSFELLKYYYSDLHATCSSISADNSSVVPALASCWGFIDALHRIREISLSTPGINSKHKEMRFFLDATKLAEEFRHYIQHLRGELANNPPNTFPVWGSLSWIDIENENKCHTAILGARFEGTQITGCVYDRINREWVSKVCLGINHKSFNFDPIYKACLRFHDFIIPLLINGASEDVKFHNKLTILTMDIQTDEKNP